MGAILRLLRTSRGHGRAKTFGSIPTWRVTTEPPPQYPHSYRWHPRTPETVRQKHPPPHAPTSAIRNSSTSSPDSCPCVRWRWAPCMYGGGGGVFVTPGLAILMFSKNNIRSDPDTFRGGAWPRRLGCAYILRHNREHLPAAAAPTAQTPLRHRRANGWLAPCVGIQGLSEDLCHGPWWHQPRVLKDLRVPESEHFLRPSTLIEPLA